MSNTDRFKRTYPIPAIVLMLPLLLIPAFIAWIQGSGALLEVYTSAGNLILLGNSLFFALLCAFISLLLGLPGAYLMAKYRFAFKGLFRWLFPLLMLLPTSILALSIKSFVCPSVNPLLPIGVVLVLSNTPLFIYFVAARWVFLDENCENCSRTLGAKAGATFLSITTSRLRSEIAFSFSLAFMRCFSDISTFRILGDGSVYLNSYTKTLNLWQAGNQSAAQMLSLSSSVILLIALLVMFLDSWKDNSKENRLRKVKGIGHLLVIIYLLASFAVFAFPIGVFVYRLFFADGTFAFAIPEIFSSVGAIGTRSLIYSSIISLAAAILCTFIAKRISFAIARNGFSTITAFLPLAFGSAALGMGFSAVGKLLPFVSPIILTTLAMVIRMIPVAVLVLLSAILGITINYTDVSRTLGYSGGASFRKIDSKLLRPSVFESFFAVFILSFGEFGTPAFLGGNTVSTQMIALLEGGDLGGSYALAALMLLVFIVFYSISFVLDEKGTSNV